MRLRLNIIIEVNLCILPLRKVVLQVFSINSSREYNCFSYFTILLSTSEHTAGLSRKDIYYKCKPCLLAATGLEEFDDVIISLILRMLNQSTNVFKYITLINIILSCFSFKGMKSLSTIFVYYTCWMSQSVSSLFYSYCIMGFNHFQNVYAYLWLGKCTLGW